jgi:hypothetical protein
MHKASMTKDCSQLHQIHAAEERQSCLQQADDDYHKSNMLQAMMIWKHGVRALLGTWSQAGIVLQQESPT